MDYTEAQNIIPKFGDFTINNVQFTVRRSDFDQSVNNLSNVTSTTKLNEIVASGDLAHARLLSGNDNRYTFEKNELSGLKEDISNQLNKNVEFAGFFWYPSGAYCGWHTNSNNTGERYYLVWAEESDKSFFRYRDSSTQEIVTNWDQSGWQLRNFTVSDTNPVWHCVGSETNRISIGFKPL